MYVKIWSDILDSSLWIGSSASVRIVWITLLVMADSDGVVRATDKAIARRAMISEEITGNALRLFQEPDAESRNPDNDGRRLEQIPGGYLVLRYTELAKLKTREEQQEATRRRVAKHRAAKASANVTPDVTNVTNVTHSDTDTDTDVDTLTSLSVSSIPTACDEVICAWNVMAKSAGLPTTHGKPSKKRIAAIQRRVHDSAWLADYQSAIHKIPSSAFLRGENDRGWKANFDWFMRPDTVTKIMEGQYDGKRCRATRGRSEIAPVPGKYDNVGVHVSNE